MDILNFISWIKGKRTVVSVDPKKALLPLALRTPRRADDYIAVAITVEDFAAQILSLIDQTSSIWSNGFINTGCINADITLPDNSTFDYVGPLTMCTGNTLTVPSGTTLTII